MRKKTLIWIGSLFTLLLAFGIGHRPLICMGAKSYLSSRLPKGGSMKFSYEKIYLEEGLFVLHDVTAKRKEGKGSPPFTVKIDDLKFRFDVQMFPFKFSPSVVMDHPQVKLCLGDLKQATSKKKDLYDVLDKLLFKTPVNIKRGEFTFGEHTAQISYECPKEGKVGTLNISKKGEEPAFAAIVEKKEKHLHFDLNFNELDTAWAFEIGQFLTPVFQQASVVTKGSLSGSVAFALSAPKHIEHIKYALNLKDFVFSNPEKGLDLHVHHVVWNEHFSSNDEMKGWESHPFFDNLWPYFIGDGEVTGLHVSLDNPERGENWAAVDVNGSIRFSRMNAPIMEFHGLFRRKEKMVPFHVFGEGKIKEDTNWKLACDAKFFDAEEIGTFFSLTSRGKGKFAFEGEGKSLLPDQISLFQHLIGSYVPTVDRIQIDQGSFDCKVSGWIEDKHLVRVDVEGLNARDVVAKFVDKELTWKGDSVFGKGEFDFSTPDFFDGTYWEARIDGGQCFYREHHLQDISLALSMHDQYLKPSVLKCQYEGLEGVFAFEGLYSHLNINVDILLYPEKLAELLHIPKPKNMSQAVALDLDMKLKTVDSRLGVEGSLGFLREGEKDDTIEFGWNWDLKRFSKGEFLKGIELGWFRGEKISARTINLPLLIWNRDFRGRGFIGLDGTFNSKAVEFTVDPSDLKYESDAIDIIPNPQGIEKAPNCNFFLDFEKKTWRGKIPLKNAEVTEHSFGLHFSSFTSEVDLEGNEFLFQNVDAISNGVRFQAEIAVDFALDDRNELKINTYSIDGDVKDVLSILRHFEPFKETQLPLSGKMKSGPGDMHLRAYVGGVEELLEWRIGLHLQDGAFPFSETFGFENLSGELFFSAEDERFKIEKVAGDLTLTAGNKPKSYALNVPLLELDAKEGVLIYDCRLEAPTYEICRVFGRGINEQDEFLLHLDPDKTRFFGARMKVDTLAFKGGALQRAAISTKLSALDVVHHIDFLNSAGLLPIKDETLDDMRGPHVDGEVSLSFLLDQSDETFSFDVKSSRLKIGAIDLDDLNLSGKRKVDSFSLDQFEAGALKIQAEMIKDHDRWRLPHLSVLWKQSFLKSGAVTFDEGRGKLKVPLEGLRLDLEEMKALLPQLNVDWDYIKGVLFAKGNVIFDFSKGWNHWTVDSELSCVGEDIGRGRLRVESPKSVRISYEMGKGVIMHQADFNFLHPRSNQLWAKVHLDRLSLKEGTIKGEGSKLIVPPEMVHFIGQTHSLPHISYEEERMIVFGYPIRWDNQIEASFDFELGDSPKMNGYLKEGYYWIGDKAWYLSSFSLNLEKNELIARVNTLYDDLPFDLRADLAFRPHFKARLTLQETCNDQRGSNPLVVQTDWNEKEGFFIQSIDGGVCGLDFAFHHNPKESLLNQIALTGQLKVNVPKFAQLMPQQFQETVSEFEIGKGYELSGGLVIHKTDLEKSSFSGYLKGKNFQLMGSQMGTLMSEIRLRPDHVELDHFTISDTSGMFAVESMRLSKTSENQWNLNIPEVVITDFRPSLLKKIGKYPTRIKPLTVRELRAHNIQGTLGDASSFVGKGNLNFINTFKRDYHILDIPFEILGRLGLDMGLLVPVRGKLEYVIVDGRVYFTELKGSYSEGKRSQFYLSPIEHSYIDFEGNINVNIKMKQYVLLKVTEPFTLSIGGTFENPKYGLR